MIVIVLPDIAAEDTLLARAVTGDQDAFRQIYDAYFAPVYQFIRLRVRDRDSAHDLAADVFLDFYLALVSRPPHTSLRAWLFRVARNKIYDHYGARRQFPTETLEEWVPSGEASPESQFLAASRVQQVRLALRSLPADQQEVLLLRFGQGLNLQHTADLMDRSISAIKSLQFRALEGLRVELARRGER
jgi:RNA polymerase sigma-70 factor (ECF subfamily)